MSKLPGGRVRTICFSSTRTRRVTSTAATRNSPTTATCGLMSSTGRKRRCRKRTASTSANLPCGHRIEQFVGVRWREPHDREAPASHSRRGDRGGAPEGIPGGTRILFRWLVADAFRGIEAMLPSLRVECVAPAAHQQVADYVMHDATLP